MIKLARKKKLIKKRDPLPGVVLKDNEFAVKRIDNKKKKQFINPLTGRKKGKKGMSFLKTTIPPEERTLKNLPRFAKQGKGRFSSGKPKVRFQDWLMLKNGSKSKHSVGQAPNGTWYGWSHRAVGSFNVGKLIKPGIIGNKFEYGADANKKYNDYAKKHGYDAADKWRKETIGKFKPYTIKTDEEAFQHADRFAADVS